MSLHVWILVGYDHDGWEVLGAYRSEEGVKDSEARYRQHAKECGKCWVWRNLKIIVQEVQP